MHDAAQRARHAHELADLLGGGRPRKHPLDSHPTRSPCVRCSRAPPPAPPRKQQLLELGCVGRDSAAGSAGQFSGNDDRPQLSNAEISLWNRSGGQSAVCVSYSWRSTQLSGCRDKRCLRMFRKLVLPDLRKPKSRTCSPLETAAPTSASSCRRPNRNRSSMSGSGPRRCSRVDIVALEIRQDRPGLLVGQGRRHHRVGQRHDRIAALAQVVQLLGRADGQLAGKHEIAVLLGSEQTLEAFYVVNRRFDCGRHPDGVRHRELERPDDLDRVSAGADEEVAHLLAKGRDCAWKAVALDRPRRLGREPLERVPLVLRDRSGFAELMNRTPRTLSPQRSGMAAKDFTPTSIDAGRIVGTPMGAALTSGSTGAPSS